MASLIILTSGIIQWGMKRLIRLFHNRFLHCPCLGVGMVEYYERRAFGRHIDACCVVRTGALLIETHEVQNGEMPDTAGCLMNMS